MACCGIASQRAACMLACCANVAWAPLMLLCDLYMQIQSHNAASHVAHDAAQIRHPLQPQEDQIDPRLLPANLPGLHSRCGPCST